MINKITYQSTIEEILRSFIPRFDHVVVAIEESNNLVETTQMSIEKLQGSLETLLPNTQFC
jgi:Fe-S cluster biogenesis protein NfuA